MAELEKGSVVFKHQAEDFIVEEVWESYTCRVSEDAFMLEKAKVDLGKLDLDDKRDFLICEAEKINIDHFSFVNILTKELHVLPQDIGYAGTKDKNAWTCQRISIFNPDLENIGKFAHPGIILKNFKWNKRKISIGELSGNHFKVVLRDVDKDAVKILNKVRNSDKLPNFFGSQRFGSLRQENVEVGKLILKQKFQEAVFAYLTAFGEQEDEEVIKAKKRLKQERNLLEARTYFPAKLILECRILDYLSAYEKDWLGALMLIGKKTLLIMCQAVQSKIFNNLLQASIDERIDAKILPLIGFDSGWSLGKLGQIQKEILSSYCLEFRDFEVPQLQFLSMKCSERNAFFTVQELDIDTINDELFPLGKKIILKFKLDSGVYATTFLEQFFLFRKS